MSNNPPTRDSDLDLDLDLDNQFKRLTAAQRNITPHDQLANGLSVDDALWNGFEKPKGIQRAGILVYSGFLLLLALAMAGIAYDKHDPLATSPVWVIAFVGIAIAIKIASNAFRTRKKSRL